MSQRRLDSAANPEHAHFKHGMRFTKVYYTWCSMIARCKKSKNMRANRYYYNRGVRCCKRWERFVNFYRDMGNPPSLDHSIDRKNNRIGYRPSNCRWATNAEQARNRRTTRFVTAFGERKCITDWSFDYRCQVSLKCLTWRIRNGTDPETAVTCPKNKLRSLATEQK